MASFIDHISIAWTGDFDSLKLLIAEDLKLDGTWEHPGGDKKVFKFNDSSISWRKSKGHLQIEGDEMGKVYQHLCKKILNSLHSSVKNVNSSDMSCQTNVDTPRLSSCTCADVAFDIVELKLGQEINREIIQAFSQSVEQVVEAMGQCKGEKSAKKGGKLVKNRKGKPATDMHRLTHAQTKEINEANNPNAPDISIIEISHQNNVGAANPNNAGTDNVSASEIVGGSEISAPNQDKLPQHTKTPKSHVPCPFLRRKGYCLKGSKCDFSHANPQQLFQSYSLPHTRAIC